MKEKKRYETPKVKTYGSVNRKEVNKAKLELTA
jgi:hypothetical protein